MRINFVCREIYDQLDQNNQLRDSLIQQFKYLSEAPVPDKDKYFTQDLINAWVHFNLRQQSEILQIFLLYFHLGNKGEDVILELLQIFSKHKFGTRKMCEKVDKDLLDSIGHLESILMVYLLDLPGLTETIDDTIDETEHSIRKNTKLVQDLDKHIGSNLGVLKPHGPPMLAWMLSHYLVNDQLMSKYQGLGQRAFSLNVIEYLSQALESDALHSNQVISAISYGVVYSLLSILVTAFDPSRMNVFNLVNQVKTKRSEKF